MNNHILIITTSKSTQSFDEALRTSDDWFASGWPGKDLYVCIYIYIYVMYIDREGSV